MIKKVSLQILAKVNFSLVHCFDAGYFVECFVSWAEELVWRVFVVDLCQAVVFKLFGDSMDVWSICDCLYWLWTFILLDYLMILYIYSQNERWLWLIWLDLLNDEIILKRRVICWKWIDIKMDVIGLGLDEKERQLIDDKYRFSLNRNEMWNRMKCVLLMKRITYLS